AITAVNHAPIVSAIGNVSTTVGAAIVVPVAATDPDNDTLTFGGAALPPGVVIDPATGLITGAPAAAGVYDVTITASDASLSGSQSFVWTVTPLDSGARVVFVQAHSSSVKSGASVLTVPYPASQSAGSLSIVVVGWNDPGAAVQLVIDSKG